MNHLQVLEDQGCTTPRFLGIFFRIHHKDLHKTYHFLGFCIQLALASPGPRREDAPSRAAGTPRAVVKPQQKRGNGKSPQRLLQLWGQRITGVIFNHWELRLRPLKF